jgi:methylenetetrahydrofolate reductase (NADPH)
MTDTQISFEFFPPRTERGRELLWENVGRLSTLGPRFMTVTYGAGGSDQDWTLHTAVHIQKDTDIPTAAHLTCIVTPKDTIAQIAHELWDNGIRHIVALRGDAPKDGGAKPAPRDKNFYHYSSDLVEGLKSLHDFEVSVAAYPEKHPDAPSLDADIEALRKKFAAGADRAITQFFFENSNFLNFRDKVHAAGITQEITAGILPIADFEKAVSFARKCGTHVPDWLLARYDGVAPGSSTAQDISADIVREQVRALMAEGVNAFHFYTLNQAGLTYSACKDMVRPL